MMTLLAAVTTVDRPWYEVAVAIALAVVAGFIAAWLNKLTVDAARKLVARVAPVRSEAPVQESLNQKIGRAADAVFSIFSRSTLLDITIGRSTLEIGTAFAKVRLQIRTALLILTAIIAGFALYFAWRTLIVQPPVDPATFTAQRAVGVGGMVFRLHPARQPEHEYTADQSLELGGDVTAPRKKNGHCAARQSDFRLRLLAPDFDVAETGVRNSHVRSSCRWLWDFLLTPKHSAQAVVEAVLTYAPHARVEPTVTVLRIAVPVRPKLSVDNIIGIAVGTIPLIAVIIPLLWGSKKGADERGPAAMETLP